MKLIPLSEPMGGDDTCCMQNEKCKQIVDTMSGCTAFRCPLMVEVGDDVEYAGKWHESCFLNNDDHTQAPLAKAAEPELMAIMNNATP